MTMTAHLPDRGVIAVTGADRVSFLNGLVSNDAAKAVPGGAVWAAILTPQGRYLADFFIFSDGEQLLLDAPLPAIADLVKKLNRFRLRAAVAIEDATVKFQVFAAWEGTPPEVPVTAPDPRLPEAGFRLLSETILATNQDDTAYNAFRLSLGLPNGPPDLEPDKTLLLEAGFDELHGVDWQKGCYMGQELTARTKYRGLVKRRLVPVTLDGDVTIPDTPILAGGQEVGSIRSTVGHLALAMLRLDALQKPLIAGSALVHPHVPAWMVIPA